MKLKYSSFGLALLTAAALPALAGSPIDKTVAARPDGDVHVANVAGSVKIEAWNRNEVHISGTLGTGSDRLAVDKTSTGVDIRVVLPHNSHHVDGTDLVIQLPAASHVDVDTVSAEIKAAGLTGPVRLESVSGEVTLASKSADITAKSVSGDVRVNGSAPKCRIEAHSISGEVRLTGVNGEVQAESVSGDVRLDGSNAINRARINSTSGNVEFAAALAPDGDYAFHAVSGDITLDLPKVPAARFDVSTFSGDIDTTFGPKPQRKSEYGPGKEWNYQSGQGNARVDINTMSGDVTLRAPQS